MGLTPKIEYGLQSHRNNRFPEYPDLTDSAKKSEFADFLNGRGGGITSQGAIGGIDSSARTEAAVANAIRQRPITTAAVPAGCLNEAEY
jgi:hypothetical protein